MSNRTHYTCRRTANPIKIDGDLTKDAWRSAERSPRFVDMVNGRPALLDTQAACLWDDERFYAAFWVGEPDVRADLTERDSLIYNENDVELFIAGKDCYYEFEINARGTIYEAFFIWQDAYTKGSRFDRAPEFELTAGGVDILGGFQDHFDHPRGPRWVFREWDFPGIETAVQVNGTLNDGTDVDEGWTVEIALPWQGMEWMADDRSLPPKEGDVWPMNFFRFEDLSGNGRQVQPPAGWSWNPHGKYDSHIPERFIGVKLAR